MRSFLRDRQRIIASVGRLLRDRKRIVASVALASVTAAAGIAAVGEGLERSQYLSAAPTAHAIAQAAAAPLPILAAQPSPAKLASAAPASQPSPSVAMLDINGVYSSRINSWVGRLTTSLKDDFEKSLGRMGQYTSMITAKLDARGMPRDLKYLAMIESEFNPVARSHAGAVGLWQFMSGTARNFGLKVGHGVDQRKDPAAETDAALSYLSSLHDRFGSWYLAAAAYNSGEGTVLRALKRITGRTTGTDADFFTILPALPKETQDYVPKLIASARIGNNPTQYGLTPVANTQPAATPVAPAVAVTKATASPRHTSTRASHRRKAAPVHAKPKRTHHRKSR